MEKQEFAKALKEAAAARGLTQQQVAFEIGASMRAVASWFLGEQLPRLEHYAALCDLFGWTRPFPSTPESSAGTGYFQHVTAGLLVSDPAAADLRRKAPADARAA